MRHLLIAALAGLASLAAAAQAAVVTSIEIEEDAPGLDEIAFLAALGLAVGNRVDVAVQINFTEYQPGDPQFPEGGIFYDDGFADVVFFAGDGSVAQTYGASVPYGGSFPTDDLPVFYGAGGVETAEFEVSRFGTLVLSFGLLAVTAEEEGFLRLVFNDPNGGFAEVLVGIGPAAEVPVPGALVLFLTGAAGLAARRR